jgi:hypothetical protein
LQWPEDFDFESTRAINRPDTRTTEKGAANEEEEEVDRPSMEKKEKEKTSSVVAGSFDAAEAENELDPVALNKAFRFAAWSSLALVSPFPSSLLIFADRD